ncbi:hypothetical protein MASR2M48_16270 [Spirochaetota bacterium]
MLLHGYCRVDRLSRDLHNESTDLKDQIADYKTQYGYYPESAHADKIYMDPRQS